MIVQRFLQNTSRLAGLKPSIIRSKGSAFALIQKQSNAFISTTKKKSDTTITADTTSTTTSRPTPKTVEDFANPNKKNFQHYGFDPNDQELDIAVRNWIMFTTVTIGVVGVGFVMTYFPDTKFKDWTMREAYIELARREALGLPLIDENLVPADQIVLPTDEELGDYDIII